MKNKNNGCVMNWAALRTIVFLWPATSRLHVLVISVFPAIHSMRTCTQVAVRKKKRAFVNCYFSLVVVIFYFSSQDAVFMHGLILPV